MESPQDRASDFVRAYWGNWWAMMSGGPSVPAAILALYVENQTARILLWATVAISFVLSAFFVWRAERQRVIALDKSAKIEQMRTELGRLRTEGVGLRNLAQYGFYNPRDEAEWEREVIEWNTTTTAAIRALDQADAEWFATLDIYPEPRVPIKGPFHDHTFFNYHMHDFRLVKLEQLIIKDRHVSR